MKNVLALGLAAVLGGVAAVPAQAQDTPPLARPTARPAAPAAEPPARSAAPTTQPRPLAAPSDEQSYRRETVFGINFNTQGGLIGGVNVRSSRVLDERRLWFWSLEGVFFKNPKEETVTSAYTGGSWTLYKTNYAFALRPSIGIQRILFRKAAEAGVQVNGLLSAGPSIGLLMPYHVSYDQTWARRGSGGPSQNDVIVNEQYDPTIPNYSDYIVDRAPFFSGISKTKIVPGVHLRGGLSFEYGRYRDAVAGAEVGFLVEAYTQRLVTFSPPAAPDLTLLNKQFLPSVYLTLYLGHRN
ncbi:MAG TPA: hypothetical protein VFO93_16175 [Hymenobacter sp.]|uniref:hypothetical protein n=1 Tax=Hymenobacter sp. TaxID=1898978 RepID=UPI002D80B432|nr:hypothetical protein [Hymenobacter sp.]HET9505081.1 hypothetical protein [Hymenobacter sp.]